MNYEITKYSRRKIGRNEQPSACIVDTQPLSAESRKVGYSAGSAMRS
ncbi:transposase, IS5 family, OrfA [Wolbachia pipientis wUni]|nr:transposase, IS5 family, OrfA [Wolbachia pipientis wUni]